MKETGDVDTELGKAVWERRHRARDKDVRDEATGLAGRL
jgi:hypothetical protein